MIVPPKVTEPVICERDGNLWETSTAVFDAARTYRYLLTRTWASGPPLVFVMLNPSTADAGTDDPTIRRCIGFACREGAGGLVVLNLFALRATDPRELVAHPEPVGGSNDEFLAAHTRRHVVIAAWGAHGRHHHRGATVARALQRAGTRLVCLGITRDGQPRHPLYTRANTPLVTYTPPNEEAA